MSDHPRDSRPVVNQNFHAQVGNVTATGDIIHYHSGAVRLIQVLEQAVENAPEIPEPEKRSLLQRLRAFTEDPYVSGLATSAIYEGIKGLIEQLSK